MNTPDHRPPLEDGDRALKEALAALPTPDDARRIASLEQRVMAQWRQTQDAGVVGAGAASVQLARFGVRRHWLVSAMGLALGLAILFGTWLHARDPLIDDLLQPDVLSQMAAGEM